MKEKKRKAGRPKLAKADVKQVVASRLTDAEKRDYESRAAKLDLSVSDWIRQAVQRA